MPSKTDKVIVTNSSALKAKYGATGVKQITATVQALIKADKARGLLTSLVLLDNKTTMHKLNAPVVINATDPRQNKRAIDGIYKALTPDYILILGAVDVIPHQDLKNPAYDPSPDGDPDQFAYGDLPYACEAGYS